MAEQSTLSNDLDMDAADIVRTSLEEGATPDQVAESLIRDHELEPIPAIRALRTGGNMKLGEAKQIVHRNLPLEQQEAAERLWNEMIAAERISDPEG